MEFKLAMRLAEYYAILVMCFGVKVICYSFNVNNVIVISQDSVKNTYFSYSLLLQAGDGGSSLIVGAPRNFNDSGSGGNIYKCNLDTTAGSTCIQYSVGRSINSKTTNGNFFGMSLDGESNENGALVACAPRAITGQNQVDYLRGYCIYIKNTSHITQPPIKLIPLEKAGVDSTCCDSEGKHYYNLGFAMAGFDVSFYSKEEILIGAPGIMKFNGLTFAYSLDNPRILSKLPYRDKPILKEEDSYFGYSVKAAEFRQNSRDVWFISGAPRANNLKGKVTVYFYDTMSKEKMNIVTTFESNEVGSYFGASVLAIDVSNDRIVDILVGAPMASGHTWDEGSVYFYKGLSEKSFINKVKLAGSSKSGSRFGTAIVSLGDFDLDGFNDIGISAPYEDDGRGAVYIYKGSVEGLTDQYSQRLSPADFNIGDISVKGFGLGISKGNDIDGNGHNDIAIGAYKSDQVFIVKSYSIIDYQIFLNPSINSIQNDTTGFNIKFCLLYTKRSDKKILPYVDFLVLIKLDYRSEEKTISGQIIATLGHNMCTDYIIRLRQTIMDISPFQINFRLETNTENIIAHGEKSVDIQIPYSHGCGDDNICYTDFEIELKSSRANLVLGLDKQINLNIMVNNRGEPAYDCKVKISVSDGIELRNVKDCIKTNGNYICPLNDILIGLVDKDFIFDMKDITPDTAAINISAEVTSLGINNPGNKEKTKLQLPIILNSTPYIVGESTPENMELVQKKFVNDMEVVHQFSIGKNGPSPLQVDVDILIPIDEHNGENIFEFVEVKGTVDNVKVMACDAFVENNTTFDNISDLSILLDRTIVVSCSTAENCTRISCKGEYLYNSGQLAVFKVRILVKSNLLVQKYNRELFTKDVIAFVPVAYQRTAVDRIGASAMLPIFVHSIRYVPLWVYLLAPSIGIILLILISYGLYRCHFFDRIYRDKLKDEKILISNDSSIEDEIFDDVVFRPMNEKGAK